MAKNKEVQNRKLVEGKETTRGPTPNPASQVADEGYSSEEFCDDPDCDCDLPKSYDTSRPTYWSSLRRYWLWALLLCILIGVNEELKNPTTHLHNTVRFYLDQPKFTEYLVGNVKQMGHVPDKIAECDSNITLKDFMTNHITDYRPCIFRKAVTSWPALQKWQSKDYLRQQIGEESVSVERRKGSNEFQPYGKDYKRIYMAYSDFLEKLNGEKKQQDFQYFYSDAPLPKALQADIAEPKATGQLLELEEVTIWQGTNQARIVAHSSPRDHMSCVVKGYQNWTVVPSWERQFVYANREGLPSDYSPVNFARPDYRRHPEFQPATIFEVDLEEGDCFYLPPYWWHQVDHSKEDFITVSHWYKPSSDWLKNVFYGLENGKL